MKTITNIMLCLFFSGILFGQSACNSNPFMNNYNFSNICKAEVSDFKKFDYRPLNYEKFLEILNDSKKVVVKFIPHKEVVLFDNNGKSYKLYFSETNKYFQIDGDSFQLSKDKALVLAELFN